VVVVLALDASVLAAIVAHAVATAWINPTWWGGYSYGPRFFTDILPYFMYFLVPVVAWLVETSKRGRMYRVAAPLFAIASIASVFVNAQGALNQRAGDWNVNPDDINQNQMRLWDWRHPPFLAGWQADPKSIDLSKIACSAPPGAPSQFVLMSNSRHTLVLFWRPASDVPTEYVVESGTAPGMSNFPDRPVRTGLSTLTIYPVPPGTYFGRVRAKNACGVSPPSNEIRVEVR
jgi:hypothetical protein